jgi:hypothetical protein
MAHQESLFCYLGLCISSCTPSYGEDEDAQGLPFLAKGKVSCYELKRMAGERGDYRRST